MRTYFTVLWISAVVTFLVTPLVRKFAFWSGAIDLPSFRKIHATPMPRLGGLAIFIGFSCPWIALYLINNRVAENVHNYEKLSLALAIGAIAMLILGWCDDVKGLSAKTKLPIQLAIAFGLYLGGFRIRSITNPFGGGVLELGIFGFPASILWMVGITNAMNLLDGVDGLVSGVTLCISLALSVMNILSGNIFVATLTVCIAGACMGFLPYNFAPARIFLGDSGSLFLGIILACTGMISLFKETTATLLLAPLILFAIPLYDTSSVMIGRILRGQHIFEADKTHIHHRLLKLGMTGREAVSLLYTFTAVLCSMAVCLQLWEGPQTLLLWMVLAACGGLTALLGFKILKKSTRQNGQFSDVPGKQDSAASVNQI